MRVDDKKITTIVIGRLDRPTHPDSHRQATVVATLDGDQLPRRSRRRTVTEWVPARAAEAARPE